MSDAGAAGCSLSDLHVIAEIVVGGDVRPGVGEVAQEAGGGQAPAVGEDGGQEAVRVELRSIGDDYLRLVSAGSLSWKRRSVAD
jgi:hypothetical protein